MNLNRRAFVKLLGAAVVALGLPLPSQADDAEAEAPPEEPTRAVDVGEEAGLVLVSDNTARWWFQNGYIYVVVPDCTGIAWGGGNGDILSPNCITTSGTFTLKL